MSHADIGNDPPIRQWVRLGTRDGVSYLTVDRPPVNAFSSEVYDELRSAIQRIDRDADGARCVVLTGAGTRAFCGGHDVNEFVDLSFDEATARLAVVQATFAAVYDCRVPVIAAIAGPAMGTGMALASVCDYRVASDQATFGLPEIDVGVLGGAKHTMRLVGQGMARYLAYTGARIDAAAAWQRHFVDEVVPALDVLPRAESIARSIAEKNPVAIELLKAGLNRVEYMTLTDGYRYECGLTARVRETPAAREGALAFLEGRAPDHGHGG
jgi:enoyl-CoA hydratase